MNKLIIKVKEIKGNCAVYKGGERIVISGPEIDLKETDKICVHALASILYYVVALREGVDPVGLGLAKKEIKHIFNVLILVNLIQTAGQLYLK